MRLEEKKRKWHYKRGQEWRRSRRGYMREIWTENRGRKKLGDERKGGEGLRTGKRDSGKMKEREDGIRNVLDLMKREAAGE